MATFLVLPLAPVVPGDEFRVNNYTTGDQIQAAVAMDADGDFVVVWTSWGQDGGGYGVFAQRYDASGTRQGGEFQVNTFTANDQWFPAVAMHADGDFVVAWSSFGQDGGWGGIFARRYAADGTPQGSEFQVNTNTAAHQLYPAVAMDAAGDFVVVWTSFFQEGPSGGVFGQRYAADGPPQGSEFQVNTYTMDQQSGPAVAMDADGNFVVAWTSFGQAFLLDVIARRYDASGTPQGGEFLVNSSVTGLQYDPTVAMDADGDFVVAWTKGAGINARRYDASGTPQGAQFQVIFNLRAGSSGPAVAMEADGDFAVVMAIKVPSESDYNIYARRYAADGTPQCSLIRVNAYGTGDQVWPAVAAEPGGTGRDFIAVWQSFGQDGDGYGVFGRGFGAPAHALTIDDITVMEGVAGTVDAVFTVTLNPTSDTDVTVDFATRDVTATASSDYQANSGTLTIPAGNSTGQITVLVNGDTDVELDETFVINLSGAVGATLCDAQGLGTIITDDPNAAFSGKVKNAAKNPVAGAAIDAYQSGVLKFSTTSDSDGRYSLPVVAGTYDLVASLAGYLDTAKPGMAINAGQTLTRIKFKLFRPSFFQGTVTEKSTGTPLEAALVKAVKNGVTVASTMTAADGSYSLQVTKGTYTLRASKAGYKTKKKLDQRIGDGKTKTGVNFALRLLP